MKTFLLCLLLQAGVAAGGLRAAAFSHHGACGGVRVLTAAALQRSSFSTSKYQVTWTRFRRLYHVLDHLVLYLHSFSNTNHNL